MVKRKTSISLDEWLERGVVTSERNGHSSVAAREEGTQSNCPTAKALPQGVKVEHVAETSLDVASHGGDESSWFWTLLEQAGYERW